MSKLQPVRGTHDILPPACAHRRAVVEKARGAAVRAGFEEIATPVFEFTEVFARTLGETSDVVSKEMYSFEDRGGEKLTLRPEFTAGVVRAFLSAGLHQETPCRFFYQGPAFRYERPQKGRMRQFHQLGVELIGAAGPLADVEVIALGAEILKELGLGGQIALEVNSLGDAPSRTAYREALVAYLARYREDLSADSQARLERNPLRILDSKDEGDKKLLAGAPELSNYYTPEARQHWEAVQEGLARLGVAYEATPHLVRGLDYYCHTAFEFVTDALGAQGTVLAGGRYDGLVAQMGGPETPAVGWAAGIERLEALAQGITEDAQRPVVMAPLGEEASWKALELAKALRCEGLRVEMTYTGNLGKRMKKADKAGARHVVMIGEEELSRGAVGLRDMESGEQREVPFEGLAAALGV